MLPAGSSKALQRRSAQAAGVLGHRWMPQILSMALLGRRGTIGSLWTGALSKAVLLPVRWIELSKGGVCLWEWLDTLVLRKQCLKFSSPIWAFLHAHEQVLELGRNRWAQVSDMGLGPGLHLSG